MICTVCPSMVEFQRAIVVTIWTSFVAGMIFTADASSIMLKLSWGDGDCTFKPIVDRFNNEVGGCRLGNLSGRLKPVPADTLRTAKVRTFV